MDDGVYTPRTKVTRSTYEVLLNTIQQQFGDQQHDILREVVDEVLVFLKNEKIKDPDKKKEIEKLLNTITAQHFSQLVSIGKLITNFREVGGEVQIGAWGVTGESLDDDIDVVVEFEEEEDDDDSDLDQVLEECHDAENDNDRKEGHEIDVMQMGGIGDDDVMEEMDVGLNVHEIYDYWLQWNISQAYYAIDPQHNQKLAEEVLKILAEEGDVQDVENRLVMLLDFEKFDIYFHFVSIQIPIN